MSKQICLKWNNHTSNLLEVFDSLLSSEAFVDVTLACEGLSLKAHKIVLSASSPFFKNLFLENPSKHPIVILKDIKFCDLKSVIKFIYSGEVSISHDQLLSFLLAAETLKVKGLEKVTAENRHALGLGEQKNLKQRNVSIPNSPPVAQSTKKTTTPSFKGKKKAPLRKRRMDSSLSDEEGVIAKITGRASPDVVDLSNDLTFNMKNDIYSGSGPSSLFMVSLHTSNSTKRTAKKACPSTSKDIEVIDDVNEVEPSNLLEQTLIVENASSVNQDNSEHTLLPTISGLETSTESINNTDVFSKTLDSTPDSNLLTPDIPVDIKPETMPFEDLSVSPVAGPSHSSARSWMQVDNLDVSLISKTKNSRTATPIKSAPKRKVRAKKKQSKKILPDSEIKQEPWKQVLHMCSDCSYTNANIEELVGHIEFHKKSAIQCEFCKIDFTELRSSEQTPEVNKNVVDCDICDHCFCSKMALLTHKLLHHY